MNVDSSIYEEIKNASIEALKVKIQADFTIETVQVPNIIGIIKGKSDDCIIIGAHFDHAGDNKNGTYKPGALDNASGTAVMMEIARVLKEYDVKPKKTILFIAFDGEEQMAYGSKYHVDNPLFPLEDTVMMNIDTVGGKENLPLKIEGYADTESSIINDFSSLAKEMKLNYEVGTSQGTDHSSFGEKGVEVVNFIHPDFTNGYHSPNDTLDNIQFDNIEDVIKLIILYLYKNAY